LTNASLPYQFRRRSIGSYASQFGGLVRVLLKEYRSSWYFFVLLGVMMPLGMLFLMKYTIVTMTPERATFLIGGNLVTSIIFGPTGMLINKLGWGRQSREFDYWAALPVAPLALILAIVFVSVLFTFPGLIGIFLIGASMLGIPLVRGIALLPLVPLGALSLVGLGAFMGSYAKNGQIANALSNLLLAFVTFLSPTLIPVEVLPAPLRFLAPFSPITYAADAFRAVMDGRIGTGLALDVLVLCLFSVGFLFLVHRKLDWRAA
jgi:ABC-2 type transport system permease protein